MTKGEAVNWIINLSADIGKIQHQDLWHYEQALSEIKDMLEAETAQKTGKWEKNGTLMRCSRCKYSSWSWEFEDLVKSFNYCPHCGADMRGEEE